MKHTTVAAFTLAVAAMAQLAPVAAQTSTTIPTTLQVASASADASTLGKLANKPLRGTNQEALGTVTDFLIDPKTGKLQFAVVPSGAGAGGETYRLVPMTAFQAATGAEGFNVQIAKSQWDQVGTLTERELSGEISLNAEQQQRIAQQFAMGQTAQPTAAASLVRASALKGKSVQSGAESLGTVEEVVIDLGQQQAAALFKPVAGVGQADQKFLVPFSQLQFSGAAGGAISTALSRTDLQQAQPGLTPTGLTGAALNPQGTATTVRQALDRDPSLARANVQVTPETKIALRGTVESEQIRSNIERTAKEAAPGVQVDNHITVQPR